MVSSWDVIAQLLALIEPEPAVAVSEDARASAPAVTPVAVDAAAVDVCVPGWPTKL